MTTRSSRATSCEVGDGVSSSLTWGWVNGKTAACLAALEPRHLPALVIAPKKVAEEVWDVETALWRPDLTISRAVGSPAARSAALTSGADIVAISRDNIGDLLKSKEALPFRTVIIDELSGFKNRATNRWKLASKIVRSPAVQNVWGLTGTPAPNGLMDLWAQIALLDHGARLGKNITTFRSRYFRPGRQLANGVITNWELREEADQKIYALISDIALAMQTEGRIELPPVTYNRVPVTLPDAVMKVYRRIERDLVVDLREIFGGEIHSADTAATLTMKLSQIAAGFMYVDEQDLRPGEHTRLHEEKIKAVRDIVDGALGSPVLVFYRFKIERQMLQDAFPEAITVDSPGAVKAWNAGKVPVLLAHPASAGHGLNLQHGGHTIVWTSATWSLEEWAQANKRLARQGQKHPVVIHVLQARGTIDTQIYQRLIDKAARERGLLDYLESPL